MPTAKDLLEKTEENFDRPPLGEDETDNVRWHVQQVGRDA